MARQNQAPERKVTKSVYLPVALIARADAQAAQEGHFNFSDLVTKAINLYLAVMDRKAADETEAA